MSDFISKLTADIEKNIIKTLEGEFVQAGSNQFQSFWTRDFCFAALGLLEVKKYEVVRNHLQKLLDSLNAQGLVPRILESSNSKKTVILSTIFRFLPYGLRKSKHNKKLIAEHFGEHGTLSIDSNSLVIFLSFQYAKKSGDLEFLEMNKEKLLKCIEFYKSKLDDQLIVQAEFEDWQDSASRSGKMFYTNLLYYLALKELVAHEFLNFDLEELELKIKETFYREGLYRTTDQGSHCGAESNYLALTFDFHPLEDQKNLYERLEQSALNQNSLPICSTPHYPASDISWTCKIVGLARYHDEMVWSWIVGLKLRSQRKLKLETEANQLIKTLEELYRRDGTIFEVYHPKTTEIYQTLLYRSESPFSWGIGINLWALEAE